MLQQLILALAYFYRLNPRLDEDEHGADVYSHEVMGVRWGFRTAEGRQLHVWSKRDPTHPLPLKRCLAHATRWLASRSARRFAVWSSAARRDEASTPMSRDTCAGPERTL